MRPLLAVLGLALFISSAYAGPNDLYEAMILREPNISINYSKIPWVLIGVTPQLRTPAFFKHDTIEQPVQETRLDPRTCPGEIAFCYQVRLNNYEGNITSGKQYSAVSQYLPPERRAKLFYCVGNDVSCVKEATHCFCMQEVDEVREELVPSDACDDEMHICRNSLLSFTLCEGNTTWCREQHAECGCGPFTTCYAQTEHACLNSRNEFVVCPEKFATCVKKYSTCYCGTEIMRIGCDSKRNTCMRDGKEYQCYGDFGDCALKYDTCECI
ncbi:MAG: hypothetical protein OXR66_00835 [Candidatus Woesearchaeota archaeon]|nr:hypothetical protein [Candidatus Woesearchaeota archaeon]